MKLDEIIDQLHEARREAKGRAEDAARDLARIDAALQALDASSITINARPTSGNLGTLHVPPLSQVVASKVAPKTTTRSEKMKAAAAEMVPCPECGVAMSKFGIATHRRTRHGVDVPKTTDAERKAASRARATAPAPKATVTSAGEMVLACSECDATFPRDKMSELSRHTITTHKRGPLVIERTPVAA